MINHIRAQALVACETAQQQNIYFTPVAWRYCRDGILRAMPVFNSHGTRVIPF